MATSALVFSISPSSKTARKNNNDEDRYMLFLAPYNKTLSINLGQLKINQSVEKSLVLVNPQDLTIKLKITNKDLNIDNLEVEIERQGNIEFKIKWQPFKPGNYNFMITYEVLNSRLNFKVCVVGACVEAPKKTAFRNIKSKTINQNQKSQLIVRSLQNNQKNEIDKENQSTIVQPKTMKSKYHFDETITSSASVSNIYCACIVDIQTPKYAQRKLRRSISHSTLTTPTIPNNQKFDFDFDEAITLITTESFNERNLAALKIKVE